MQPRCRIFPSAFLVACMLGATALAFGQSHHVTPGRLEVDPHPQAAHDEPRGVYVTDRFVYSPEGQAALQRYHEAVASGLLPVAKTSMSYAIGTNKDFNVLTNLVTIPSWKSMTFTLAHTSDLADVWVGEDIADQFDGVSYQGTQDFFALITQRTPEGSFRPDRGIIENNIEVFGNHPDAIDADGKVDILLFDIVEGGGDSNTFVAGYFHPVDLDPTAADGVGNKANVLYLDFPQSYRSGGMEGIASVLAHEQQHLIHANYDRSELTFLNEGLSEWAQIVNGFPERRIGYLSDPNEHRTPLFDWSGSLHDYQRAGLFISYVAERLGVEATGAITRAKCTQALVSAGECALGSSLSGPRGFSNYLKSLGMTSEEIVADFHTANYVNDRALGEEYGYTLPQRQSFPVRPSRTVSGLFSTPPDIWKVMLGAGAVSYLSWTSVDNLQLTVSEPGDPGATRDNVALHLFTEAKDGSTTLTELDPNVEDMPALSDAYHRVTLIVSNTKPGIQHANVELVIEASWNGTTVAYEEGLATLFFVGREQTHIANAFVLPPNARLSAIYYAGVFNNEFVNSGLPNDAPRDYRVTIWDQEQDLFSMEVREPVNGRHITFFAQAQAAIYVPAEITLPPEDPTFSSLPDNIFIGIGNAGTDRNYLGVMLAPRSTPIEGSLSYWHDTVNGVTTWWAMEELSTQGGSLADFVHPIRARFIIPVSTVDPGELPTAVDLQQNYPNPFNPTTSIGWSLAAASPVRLSVHNVLGQRVATLVDGIQPAGTYETRLDASGWASGVYVYVLETGAQTLTRRMVVLK